MLKITAVILFLAILLGTVAAICPPEILTRPCTCTENDGNVLRCENITESIILSGVFRRTAVVPFSHLQLVNVNIKAIPPLSLVTKQIKTISIEDSNMTTFLEKSPPLQNNLQAINMKNVSFEEPFQWNPFKNLKHLILFVAIGVKIPALDSSFKNNVGKNLTYFALSNTGPLMMDDGVLSEFKNLEDVRIENCPMPFYKRNYFSRPSNIISLYLDGNQMETLPADAFDDFSRLQSLDLSNNKLSTIPDGMFSKIKHRLSNLNLDGNPLNCDCGFNWLISNPPKYEFKGKCETPEKLKGKSVKDLKSNDLDSCH